MLKITFQEQRFWKLRKKRMLKMMKVHLLPPSSSSALPFPLPPWCWEWTQDPVHAHMLHEPSITELRLSPWRFIFVSSLFEARSHGKIGNHRMSWRSYHECLCVAKSWWSRDHGKLPYLLGIYKILSCLKSSTSILRIMKTSFLYPLKYI